MLFRQKLTGSGQQPGSLLAAERYCQDRNGEGVRECRFAETRQERNDMKVKPTRQHGVVVELGPNEQQLPAEQLFNLKRILVPVDFSACSQKALAYALPLARQFGARIILLHVIEPYVPIPEMSAVDWEAIAAYARRDAEAELAKLRSTIMDDVPMQLESRVGRADRAIVTAADELAADLIVISTHGRTGMGRVLMGSVAEHVTRYAHCPVLTVRERERDFVRGATARESVQDNASENSLNPIQV